MHLIDLWLTVAVERPDGILTGWDEVDIALAANWPGDPAEFMRVAMLEHCKWIEKHGDTYKIHDWEEHQGWACSAKERSEKAKKAAKARWAKRLKGKKASEKIEENQGVDATSNAQALLTHQSSNAPSPSPSPNPSIIVDGKPSTSVAKPAPSTKKPVKLFAADSDEIRLSKLLYTLILEKDPKAKKPKLQSWAEHIDLMIRIDKRTPVEIESVIRFCQLDPFWCANILSTKKLREKFTALVAKMKQGDRNGKSGGYFPENGSGDDGQAGRGKEVPSKYAGIGKSVCV
ncbi:MAG: hypothetical protein M0P44_06580 [Clostridiales bacterium]|nr:hypothetical protein [Clostridiales bacterium]